jgi:hypothetical protein
LNFSRRARRGDVTVSATITSRSIEFPVISRGTSRAPLASCNALTRASPATLRARELTMSDNPLRSAAEDDDYKAFARKMSLFDEGPTTTNFQQLIEKGVALPRPDEIADADVRTKLWEVLSGLSELRVYLDHTDHLSERELYAKLWNETLREDVPAIDEIGFNTHVQLLSSGEEADTALYLKHFADEKSRDYWIKDFPDYPMPVHEDPPYNRDCLLPRPAHEGGPEALAWLRANHNESALATNRFSKTSDAIAFVEQLYAAGATGVWVDNIMMLPHHDWTPYADTLIVDFPDGATRHEVLELIEHVGRPDRDAGEPPPHFIGPSSVRLWWD